MTQFNVTYSRSIGYWSCKLISVVMYSNTHRITVIVWLLLIAGCSLRISLIAEIRAPLFAQICGLFITLYYMSLSDSSAHKAFHPEVDVASLV